MYVRRVFGEHASIKHMTFKSAFEFACTDIHFVLKMFAYG